MFEYLLIALFVLFALQIVLNITLSIDNHFMDKKIKRIEHNKTIEHFEWLKDD